MGWLYDWAGLSDAQRDDDWGAAESARSRATPPAVAHKKAPPRRGFLNALPAAWNQSISRKLRSCSDRLG